MVGGGVEKEGDMLGELSIEEFFMGEENFHEGSVKDLLALFTKKKQ